MNKTQQHNWEWEVSRIACHNMAQKVLALDVSDVVISDALQNRVDKLLAKERATARKRLIRRRVVAVLIAAALLALTACMSIPTVREKLYKIVITYYDEFFSYMSVPVETDEVTQPITEVDSDPVNETHRSETTKPNEFVFEKRLPSYLPAGYELYMDDSAAQVVRLYYFNADAGSIVQYEQSVIGTTKYEVNSENAQIQKTLIHGNEGIVSIKVTEDCTEITLVWNDGIYDYSIDTTLTLEETIKIAESIR